MKTLIAWWRSRHSKPTTFARLLAVHVANSSATSALQ